MSEYELRQRLLSAQLDCGWLRALRDEDSAVIDDLRAEIARLNAKIKRREAELLYRRERIPPRGGYAEAVQRARNETRWARVRRPTVKRKLRIIHEAKAAWTIARTLRLSDPSFAGRLP